MNHSLYLTHVYIFDEICHHYCILRRIRDRRMPPINRNLMFDEVWKELLEGIEQIYQLKSMTIASWMKLFT